VKAAAGFGFQTSANSTGSTVITSCIKNLYRVELVELQWTVFNRNFSRYRHHR